MRRAGKIALWVLAVIILLPVLLVAIVLIFANTGPGQRLIETEADSLTGGMVKLAGLHGRFPDALRLDHLEVHDAKGAWLTADGVVLDWSPSALIGLRARIDTASVQKLAVLRLPVPAAPAKPAPPSKPFSLPVAIDLRALTVARADIGAPVAGAAATLRITGHADVQTLQAGAATLDIARLDSAGAYHVDGVLAPATITAHVTLHEPQGGLIASLAKMPALGGLAVDLSVDGPKTAEHAHVLATAGQLSVTGDGHVNIPGQTEDVTLAATAPAMAPRPDISWQGIDLHAHVAGTFTKPDATAHLAVNGLSAGGATLPSLVADVNGNQGQVGLHAVLTGLKLPGPKPDLFASAPLDLVGSIRLDTPARPVTFRLTHTLLTADGTAQTGGDIAATIHTAVPDLAPLAAIGNVDIRGSTDATATLKMHDGDYDVGVTGTADFTGGQAPVPTLLGPTKFAVSATMAGQDIIIHDAQVNGRAINADVTGTDKPAGLDLAWKVALTDLSALSPQVLGALKASGTVSGATNALAATADVTGDAGSKQFARAPVSLTLRADHLPAAPNATVQGAFRLAGAPVSLQATAATDPSGTLHVVLKRADWKSLVARADLSLPKGTKIPLGTADIRMAQIGDAAALAGQNVTGGLTAKLTSGANDAKIDVRGSNLAAGTRRVAALSLNATASGIDADPDVHALLTLTGIDADGITGAATVNAAGRQSALQLRAHAGLQNLKGAPATLDTAALLDAKAKQVTLQTLTADWKTLAVRLQGPSRIAFGAQTSVDHLRIAVNQAQIALAGRVAPTLDLTASLRNVTPDLAHAVMPDLQAAGVVTADARLTGTTAAPVGTVHLNAVGLRLRTGPAAAIPPANIAATVGLRGTSASLDARAEAGPKLHLTASGTAPLAAGGALALRTRGTVDLALLDPILQAEGRQARGRATLDIAASGSTSAPRIDGTITLAGGEIQDFVQGLHLTGITARIDAAGDTLRIAQFTANAAPGTISITGTVGALAPGLPVDLRITARQARPLASDLLTATLDADLSVRGHASGEMLAAGKILLHRVEITIPDSLPPSVAVLHVRRPGDKPPPPVSNAPPAAVVRLNIVVDAPRNIFVRGHGLDAELGGKLTIAGTSAAPQINGGFDMRRGDFSLAGTTLNFSKGAVGFDGTGVTGKIDPTLNFQADSTSGSVTATLKVTGYADAPKLALSSTPDLPQDEVLAHLLFGQSVKQLSPLQIAEIGAALAELSGVTGGGDGPLGSIRKGLGLDRLSVGGGTNGAGATVEAGRYVANGVYVGAKQSAGGAGGTQAQVQVDLTRHLKLQTTLGTGGGSAQGATPDNDPGSSVGLSYQFEY